MRIDRSPDSRLQQLVTQGLISENKHPTDPLWIYNYTPTCVYSKAWNRLTLQCRGLILAENGEVIARPFEKFFNVQEHSSSDIRWKKSFQVFEKLDGSLGIMYKDHKGNHNIATRGSFTSDQALSGTEMLNDVTLSDGWVPNDEYTYLFEIIYPENRIVVNYGKRRELVFLCAVHIETGANVFKFGNEWDWPGPRVKRYENAAGLAIRDLHTMEIENEEGFVVFFPHNSTRMKTKFTEYVRLHKIVTKTNTKNIWQGLKNGDSIEHVIEDTPDEFHDWVKSVIADLQEQYCTIEAEAIAKFNKITVPNGDFRERRKAFAIKAQGHRLSGILFKMWDGKDYAEIIWKMVKPDKAEGFSTFNVDEEV